MFGVMMNMFRAAATNPPTIPSHAHHPSPFHPSTATIYPIDDNDGYPTGLINAYSDTNVNKPSRRRSWAGIGSQQFRGSVNVPFHPRERTPAQMSAASVEDMRRIDDHITHIQSISH